MKKIMTLICGIVMATVANAQRVENNIVRTAPFAKVEMGVTANVRVVDGMTFAVKVNSTCPETANDILVSVKNGVLNVSSKSGNSVIPEDERLIITVITPGNPDIVAANALDTNEIKSNDKFADKVDNHRFFQPRPFAPHSFARR